MPSGCLFSVHVNSFQNSIILPHATISDWFVHKTHELSERYRLNHCAALVLAIYLFWQSLFKLVGIDVCLRRQIVSLVISHQLFLPLITLALPFHTCDSKLLTLFLGQLRANYSE